MGVVCFELPGFKKKPSWIDVTERVSIEGKGCFTKAQLADSDSSRVPTLETILDDARGKLNYFYSIVVAPRAFSSNTRVLVFLFPSKELRDNLEAVSPKRLVLVSTSFHYCNLVQLISKVGESLAFIAIPYMNCINCLLSRQLSFRSTWRYT